MGIKSPLRSAQYRYRGIYAVLLPIVHQERETITSYYYAGGGTHQMRHGQSYYYVFGDQFGQHHDGCRARYRKNNQPSALSPLGTTRYSTGEQATDYGYTGQMKVDNIYYYNARWYDPAIGRFMQADTIVPLHQGTVLTDMLTSTNNPMIYTDPRHFLWLIVAVVVFAITNLTSDVPNSRIN